MAHPSASAVGPGGTAVGGPPSSSPPLGTARAPFRRQGSSYGPSHVHHMALMVAPKRVDYSVNKGGLKSWIVLIVFVLLCSAILTIFSDEELTERDLANNNADEEDEDTLLSDQNKDRKAKDGSKEEKEEEEEEEEEGTHGAAHLPSGTAAAVAAGAEEDEMEEEDEDEGEPEDEEEEEEQQQEKEEREDEKEDEKEAADDAEERMLARLKETAMARRRQKEVVKLKAKKEEARKEAAVRKQKVGRTEGQKGREKERLYQEEEENESDNEGEEDKVKQEEQLIAARQHGEDDEHDGMDENDDDELAEEGDEADEEEEDHQQILLNRRDRRHGTAAAKQQKRVPSWRDTQLHGASRADQDIRKPRMNLLKQRKKKFAKYEHANEDDVEAMDDREEEEEEEEMDEHGDDDDDGHPNDVGTELTATRKRPIYSRKALTNRYDYRHRSLLDEADFLLEKHEFEAALKHYEQILAQDSHSPRALFGRGRLHQLRAEFDGDDQQTGDSAEFRRMALSDYNLVLKNEETPDELFKMTVHHFVECARFMGDYHHKILQVQRALVDRFPDDADIKCEFGITWLGMDRPEKAASIFRNVLEAQPGHALALAYLGYIQKVHEEDALERGVHALRRAMRTGDQRVVEDTRFYFHLGDGLVKLGRTREALEVYAEAVRHGLYPSVLQRSVHNLLGLSARPWWKIEQTECSKQLKAMERHWTIIREEASKAWNKKWSNDLFVPETLSLASGTTGGVGGGEWTLTLRSNAMGGFRAEICDRLMPATCDILKQFAAASCSKDKIKLSVLLAGTRTWPFCGPTNYVLEAQLGLVVSSDARIRVGNETKGWHQGRFLLFDTSFEREISFEGAPANALRLALTLELWHPQVPAALRGKIRHEIAVVDKD